MNRLVALSAQIAACCLAWVGNYYYPDENLEKAFLTFLALAAIYFVFRIGLEHAIVRTIKDSKTRYSVRKATSILYLLVFLLVLIRIWIEDSQALLVSYGLIGAGIAIALQDLFKNFVGGIVIFITGTYRVGDRVEIESHYGDVIDIGLLFTTLLEMRGWIDGDQATGRLTVVPNGRIISGVVNNYTKDHSFIWDEIMLPITYDSDWKDAVSRISRIVAEETREISQQAEAEMSGIMKRYYLSKRSVEPAIFVRMTDNWISLSIRYIALARERRTLQDNLHRRILQEIRDSGNIKVASTTIDITHFPEGVLRLDKP